MAGTKAVNKPPVLSDSDLNAYHVLEGGAPVSALEMKDNSILRDCVDILLENVNLDDLLMLGLGPQASPSVGGSALIVVVPNSTARQEKGRSEVETTDDRDPLGVLSTADNVSTEVEVAARDSNESEIAVKETESAKACRAAKNKGIMTSIAKALEEARAQWVTEVEEFQSKIERATEARDEFHNDLVVTRALVKSHAAMLTKLEQRCKGANKFHQDALYKMEVCEKKLNLSTIALCEIKEKLLEVEADRDGLVVEIDAFRRNQVEARDKIIGEYQSSPTNTSFCLAFSRELVRQVIMRCW
ncbi:hypothetical protein NE237_027420 [Protea cynaroides]|uniref:Uncharacterized protein n=1 Tax=Protea cynaroides TaxID=273540 RepID=A0A9Q0GQ41_9MAGN|nr:hypothetical protein NE237_027420 [Protea cynaroides]